MKIGDSRSLGGSVLPLQHSRYDRPPHSRTPWALELRTAVLAARVTDRLDGAGQLGHYVIDPEHVGDVTGALLWPRDRGGSGRPLPAWSWVYPAFVVADATGTSFGRGGPITARVVRRPWEPDTRLAVLRTDPAPGANTPPVGSLGLVVAAQDESEQYEIFFSPQTQAAIIAPWRGGTEEHGTIVYDLTTKAELDPIKHGRVQHLLRVTHAQGQWQPAINLTTTALRSPGGYGLCWGHGDSSGARTAPVGRGGVAHWLSWERLGPIHPGHATRDKHRTGTNAEGEPEQPAHLWIESLFYRDAIADGPLNHTFWRPGGDLPVPVRVRFGWNGSKWDWWTTSPIIPPPWIPHVPEDPPPWIPWRPEEGAPPRIPADDPPVGVPVPRRRVGEPEGPRPGTPANPSLHETELAVPSLVLLGTRDRNTQPGQGPYGGAGRDTTFDPITTPNGTSLPVPPHGGGFLPPDPFGGGDATEEGQPTPEGLRLRELRRTGAQAFASSQEMRRTGRVGHLTESARERGGPSPLVGHVSAVASVSPEGQWRYASQPGRAWGNGTARAGALLLGPMLVPDGPDDQSEWLGAVDVLLYQGSHGGTPARFGWGRWSPQAEDWRDGCVLSLTGSAGSYDTRIDWRDGVGNPRVGVLGVAGHVRPTVTSAYSLGSAIQRWATVHTDAVGALSAPAGAVHTSALNVFGQALFADGTAAAPAISFTSDPDTGFVRAAADKVWAVLGGAIAGAWLSAPSYTAWLGRVGLSGTVYTRCEQTRHKNLTDIANVGAAETTLATITLAANELAANGDEYEVVGHFNVTTSPVTIRLRFGGSLLATITTSATGRLTVQARIGRTGAAAQRCLTWVIGSATSTATSQYAVTAENLATALQLRFTGQGVASNQVTQQYYSVSYLPAPV